MTSAVPEDKNEDKSASKKAEKVVKADKPVTEKKIIEASIEKPGNLMGFPTDMMAVQKDRKMVVVASESAAKSMTAHLAKRREQVLNDDYSDLRKCLDMKNLHRYIDVVSHSHIYHAHGASDTDQTSAVTAINKFAESTSSNHYDYVDHEESSGGIMHYRIMPALVVMIHRATPVKDRYSERLVIPAEVTEITDRVATASKGMIQYAKISDYLTMASVGDQSARKQFRKDLFEKHSWMKIDGFLDVEISGAKEFIRVVTGQLKFLTEEYLTAAYRNSVYYIRPSDPYELSVETDKSHASRGYYQIPTIASDIQKTLASVAVILEGPEQKELKQNTFKNALKIIDSLDLTRNAVTGRSRYGDNMSVSFNFRDAEEFGKLPHFKKSYELETKIRKGDSDINVEKYVTSLLRKCASLSDPDKLSDGLDPSLSRDLVVDIRGSFGSNYRDFKAPSLVSSSPSGWPGRDPMYDKPLDADFPNDEALLHEVVEYAGFVKTLYTSLFTNHQASKTGFISMHSRSDHYPEPSEVIKSCDVVIAGALRTSAMEVAAYLKADPLQAIGRKYGYTPTTSKAVGLEWCSILNYYHSCTTMGHWSSSKPDAPSPTPLAATILIDYARTMESLRRANAALSQAISDAVIKHVVEPHRIMDTARTLQWTIGTVIPHLLHLNNNLIGELTKMGVCLGELHPHLRGVPMLMVDPSAEPASSLQLKPGIYGFPKQSAKTIEDL